jgi:hypothetical protein
VAPGIRAGIHLKQIAYSAEAEQTVQNLPKSFGELRMAKNAKEGDPSPLTLQTVGQDTYVFFPTQIPDERKDKVLPSLSCLMELARLAGFICNGSEREIDNSFWNLMESMTDSIRGAFYCLSRPPEQRVPVDNVPSELKRGWNFGLWYAFSSAAKINEWNDGYTIPRCTTMQSADKGQWSVSKTFSDIDRLNGLVRSCAAKLGCQEAPVVKFLKGEGYFTSKFVGKKPVSGLYTEQEFSILKEDWERRMTETKLKYKKLVSHNLRDAIEVESLSIRVARMQSAHSRPTKVIEEAKSRRIPELLVSEGRGRSTKKVIAKGSDLPEKLISIKGGESVRTIAKVMYSPLSEGLDISNWTNLVMGEARLTNLRQETLYQTIMAKERANVALSANDRLFLEHYPSIKTAVQVYMEIIPDRTGNSAWDTTFGVYNPVK